VCVEEAILQGLLELVERDAVAIWWFNRLQVPGVDVDSFQSEYATAWRRRRAAAGMHTWVLDLTHDLGVPVLAAIAESSGGAVLYGFGAHTDPEIALTRALTEVNQSLPYLRRSRRAAGPRTDLTGWLEHARVERLPWLRPADAPPRAHPDAGSSDVAAQVRTLVRALAAHELEVLVVDQSRPDVPLNVVRTIVPGLRHFWRRLAPGRLYTVPVALGLRARALGESEFNEWDIYF
jgi:thiazole/oxazole-forming peptide maturase SagD family component